MKKVLYILTFILLTTSVLSQKEYHNWVFGDSCYITFDTPSGNPEFVKPLAVSTFENTSVISNNIGELQYFSFENYIYNSDNELIYDKADGNNSSTQGGCIFQISENRFIRVGSNFSKDFNTQTNLSYNYITKNSDNTIVSEKIVIDSTHNTEALHLFRSKLIESVYLVTLDILDDNEKGLLLYKFSNNSFKLIQEFRLNHNLDISQSFIKYSMINNLIAITYPKENKIQFLRFDPKKEKVQQIISDLNLDLQVRIWGIEFSPNGDFLYCSAGSNLEVNFFRIEGLHSIQNVDLSINYLNDLNNNINSNGSYGILLGPNRKIYLAPQGKNYLTSIENPDSRNGLKLIEKAVSLNDTKARLGLPNIPTSFYDFYDFKDSIVVCLGEDILLESNMNFEYDDTTYVWSGPNRFTSDLRNPIIENADIDDAGTYSVVVHNSDSSISYESEIVVAVETDIKNPKIVVSPDSIVCNTDEVKLSVVGIYENFEWTTGETTLSITVTESGTYGVEHINDNGCVGYSEVNIKFGDDITTDIIGPTEICEGSGEIYSADRDYETYKWSNGEDTKTTLISEAGRYWLEVTTAEGCTISDTIDISYHPEITAELKPVSTTICEGDSVLLESLNDFPYYSYEWNTGATTRGIYVKETDTYKLTVTDTRTGCMDSTEIAISVEDNLRPTISGMDICAGNPATLEVLPNDPSYSFEWSNGETSPTIVVSQPATYTVTVSKDGCSGTAEFIVNESPNPEFEILGEDIVCGNTAILRSDKDFVEYLWSTDEVTKEIVVTEPGTYSLTVTDENGCQATEEFTVNEQSLSFEISKNRIDFGKVYISETAIDSVTIINRSGIELTITDGTQNYTIPDGFPVQYTKTLEPTELGPYTDSFEYRVISPCDTVITVPVTAEVYAKVEISTKEETETKIGDEVSIPVYLQAEADLGEQTYTITTDIDQKALYTEDDYTITQTAPINKAKTQIHEISGMIMLASELEYEITFPSYEFNNPYIEVTTESGTIKIDSVCAFPMRNVTFTETTEMKVSPNPARDRLVVVVTTGHFDKLNDQSNKSVAEPVEASAQQMKLELISEEGRVAYTENWTQTSSEKQLSINTDKIPSGLYQVRLQTPSGVLTENVIVVR
jgi:hypothetical protein